MFYECVLIIRPDVSSKYVMEFVQGIQEVIEKSGGKVHATEYWGFRSLAYPIAKRAKAHYVCLGMEASSLEALNHYLKFHKDLLRFLFIKKPITHTVEEANTEEIIFSVVVHNCSANASS